MIFIIIIIVNFIAELRVWTVESTSAMYIFFLGTSLMSGAFSSIGAYLILVGVIAHNMNKTGLQELSGWNWRILHCCTKLWISGLSPGHQMEFFAYLRNFSDSLVSFMDLILDLKTHGRRDYDPVCIEQNVLHQRQFTPTSSIEFHCII